MAPEVDQEDEDGYPETNLAEIVGRDDYSATRVATFLPDGDRLVVSEACDDYFGVALDKTEVRRLIDWLNDWVSR